MRRDARTIVVLNPAAAGGRVGRHADAVAAALRDAGIRFELVRTERAGHAASLVPIALQDGFEQILAVGGDGTLNEVLNGMYAGKQPRNPDAVLATLPFGTGTDFRRSLELPRGLHAIERILHGRPRAIDVGCVTHGLTEGGEAVRYFLNVADFGVGGEVVRRVNATTKLFGGFASFLYGVVSTLLTYQNPRMRLEIDGEQFAGRISNVILANGRFYGGGMHVAPEARLDSGGFEIYVIGDVGTFEAIVNLPKLYRGHLLKRADKVQYLFATQVVARSDETVLLNLDGEQPGRLPATFEILPRSLQVIA